MAKIIKEQLKLYKNNYKELKKGVNKKKIAKNLLIYKKAFKVIVPTVLAVIAPIYIYQKLKSENHTPFVIDEVTKYQHSLTTYSTNADTYSKFDFGLEYENMFDLDSKESFIDVYTWTKVELGYERTIARYRLNENVKNILKLMDFEEFSNSNLIQLLENPKYLDIEIVTSLKPGELEGIQVIELNTYKIDKTSTIVENQENLDNKAESLIYMLSILYDLALYIIIMPHIFSSIEKDNKLIEKIKKEYKITDSELRKLETLKFVIEDTKKQISNEKKYVKK